MSDGGRGGAIRRVGLNTKREPRNVQIRDLPAPVTASKADWLAGTTWMGFTPVEGDLTARNKCQSTIQRQFGNGYVIEYITEQFNDPNPGFENDPTYLTEREAHRELAGRLIAVHKLRTTARPLEEILGAEEFKKLQDMWAQGGKRYRWSVAFPIVESYEISGYPKAKAVLGDTAYRRLYQRSSATLRTLTDDETRLIADLELTQISARNSWIAIEDEFRFAEASEINHRVELDIGRDLAVIEGVETEKLTRIKRRAAWIADSFVRKRKKAGTLICDDCAFNPRDLAVEFGVNPRSLLDVHHKNPLSEGVRYTTTADFALLCPTCHRVEHVRFNRKIVRE